ncbi:MAG: hypothetical protein ACR2HQ_13145, partial [Ilumatobacteraceae bacterium]
GRVCAGGDDRRGALDAPGRAQLVEIVDVDNPAAPVHHLARLACDDPSPGGWSRLLMSTLRRPTTAAAPTTTAGSATTAMGDMAMVQVGVVDYMFENLPAEVTARR